MKMLEITHAGKYESTIYGPYHSFEYLGSVIIIRGGQWGGEMSGVVKLLDTDSWEVRDATPDEEVYRAIGALNDEDFEKVKNFLTTTGII